MWHIWTYIDLHRIHQLRPKIKLINWVNQEKNAVKLSIHSLRFNHRIFILVVFLFLEWRKDLGHDSFECIWSKYIRRYFGSKSGAEKWRKFVGKEPLTLLCRRKLVVFPWSSSSREGKAETIRERYRVIFSGWVSYLARTQIARIQ